MQWHYLQIHICQNHHRNHCQYIQILPKRMVKILFTNSGRNPMVSNTANEGPERIQYKCLVLHYVFPEMKLLFLKQNYNVLSPSPYSHTVYL
jgi:hypothetical protein